MEKHAKLIIKESFWNYVPIELITEAIVEGGLQFKEHEIESKFFTTIHTFVVYGEISTIIKVWKALKTTGLNIKLEEEE